VIEYGVVMAGAILALLPLLIAFLFAQRYFIQGIAMSGMKD
jgi:multiple sugar transport system permease protein